MIILEQATYVGIVQLLRELICHACDVADMSLLEHEGLQMSTCVHACLMTDLIGILECGRASSILEGCKTATFVRSRQDVPSNTSKHLLK